VSAVTVRVAVPVAVPSVPVTMWAPAAAGVQVAPGHEPSGAMAKEVDAVTSPLSLPKASKPSAVHA
jgi:hypothetical protein